MPRDEVVRTLKSHGVDLDNNRFLILQGEVEQISTMKPKGQNPKEVGLLEYLEEIIGSDQYVEAINTASEELDRLNEEKRTRSDRLKLARMEKEGLESAKNQAVDFLNKNKELCDKKAIALQIQKHKIISKNKSTIEKKMDLQSDLDEKRKEIEQQTDEYKHIKVDYDREKKEISKVEKAYEKAKNKLLELERQDIEYTNKISQLEKSIDETNKTMESEKKKLKKNEVQKAELSSTIESTQKKTIELSDQISFETDALERIYENLREELKPLQHQLAEKQKELMPYKKAESEAQSKVELAEAEKRILEERCEAAKADLENFKNIIEEKKGNSKKLSKELPIIESDIEKLKGEQETLEKDLEELKKMKSTLNQDIESHTSELDGLNSSLETDQSRGALMDEVLKASESGVLTGVHGRLGDLGEIDSKYNEAISIACGALNYIVVSDTKAGERCVDFLRKNNLGRATFIMLDKMKRFEKKASQPISVPKGAQRLFDLVKKDDKMYNGAFYYALRDTLVCENADLATKISFGESRRWRVVTLDGQLIEISGTMSGGGRRKGIGGMKNFGSVDLKDLNKKIKEYTQKLAKLTSQYEQVISDIKIKEHSLDTTIKSIKKLEIDLRKMKLELETNKSAVDDLEDRIPQLEKDAKLSTEEKKKLKEQESLIKECQSALSKTKSNAASLEATIREIQYDIENVGGEEVANQKEKIKEMRDKLEEMENELAKCESKLKTTLNALEKSTRAIRDCERDIQKCETKKSETEEKLGQIQEEMELVITERNESLESLDNMKQQIADKEQLVKKFNDDMNCLKSLEVDLTSELKTIERSMKEFEAKINSIDQKIEDLDRRKDQLKIDDDDMELSVPHLSESELSVYDYEDLQITIQTLEQEIEKKKPNLSAIKEYNEKLKAYNEKQEEYDIATADCEAKRGEYEDLRIKRLHQFSEGLSKISLKLKEMYRMITMGGDADLELNDSSDPFSEGITFSVRPPGKSWKNIQNLSGGEKTLSSLSLVFALHYYKPTPIYVMDEIDAALDFKNVSIVANYIKERTKNAQFIIISLRNYMFELADRLVGIYKTNNTTKSVTVNPKSLALRQA